MTLSVNIAWHLGLFVAYCKQTNKPTTNVQQQWLGTSTSPLSTRHEGQLWSGGKAPGFIINLRARSRSLIHTLNRHHYEFTLVGRKTHGRNKPKSLVINGSGGNNSSVRDEIANSELSLKRRVPGGNAVRTSYKDKKSWYGSHKPQLKVRAI